MDEFIALTLLGQKHENFLLASRVRQQSYCGFDNAVVWHM